MVEADARAAAATVVAPATVVVAISAVSGGGGGHCRFALTSQADGDAVEGQVDQSSHPAGFFGSIWRIAGVSGVKPLQRL